VARWRNLSAFNIAIIVLVAVSNRIEDLRPLVPQILEALATARAGRSTVVTA
jgi:hypothetical protein